MNFTWSKLGRHLVTDWESGTMQIVRDDGDHDKPFKYTVFEVGAIIGQGRAASLAEAKRLSEACLPGAT